MKNITLENIAAESEIIVLIVDFSTDAGVHELYALTKGARTVLGRRERGNLFSLFD